MNRGIYIGGAAMNVAQTRARVLANNLANVGTPGFKEDRVSFTTYLEHAVNARQSGRYHPVGPMDYGVAVNGITTNLAGGPLKYTGNKYDLALQGEGYFTVQAGEDTLYTRDGSFHVDASGSLVTADGRLVLGQNGPITLAPGDFEVRPDGTILQNGAEVDRLRIMRLPAGEPEAWQKNGENYFDYQGNTGMEEATSCQVQQGALEGSNTDLAAAMLEMQTVVRTYQAGQKIISAHDQLLNKLINQAGKVG
ncbi:MAG: flagellar hook-basal body protein [Peptococcaceae bacterium]|nr:flagellar hook-basal body protein [Peptococcaceae bacterium]